MLETFAIQTIDEAWAKSLPETPALYITLEKSSKASMKKQLKTFAAGKPGEDPDAIAGKKWFSKEKKPSKDAKKGGMIGAENALGGEKSLKSLPREEFSMWKSLRGVGEWAAKFKGTAMEARAAELEKNFVLSTILKSKLQEVLGPTEPMTVDKKD